MKRWKASLAGKIKSSPTLPREKGVPRENIDRYLAQKIQKSRISMNSIKALFVQRENSIKMQVTSSPSLVELDRIRLVKKIDKYHFQKRDLVVLCEPSQKNVSTAVIYIVHICSRCERDLSNFSTRSRK